MEILAEEQKAGRLNIQPVAILLGGEKLYPNVRAELESVFQVSVLDLYGSTEAAAMTFECEEGQLHVNTDWIIFEPVDEHYQPVPLGEQSHSVLITNLEHRGVLGTGIFRIFDLHVGQTGLTEKEAEKEGYEFEVLYNLKPDHA